MKLTTQIRNWLAVGFEQPVGSLNEDFYYDRKSNEFFSIVLTDQFMFDENLNLQRDITTTYSTTHVASLADRLKRIDSKDQEIIAINRISLDERKSVMQDFADGLANPDLLKIVQQRIFNQDYRTKFEFYFGGEADDLTKEKREAYKDSLLQQKADSFLNLHNIDIGTATIWEPAENGSVTIHLTTDEVEKNNVIEIKETTKKRWWKFW